MNFEYAKITRSRLMGSMGLVIKHSDNEIEIFEYYLLDCEGLGFCDYVRLENPTKEEAYMEEERLMGGLCVHWPPPCRPPQSGRCGISLSESC